MFEFLFKYPGAVFHRGQFVLLAPWPLWILALGILAAGGLLLWHVRRNRGLLSGARPLLGVIGDQLLKPRDGRADKRI